MIRESAKDPTNTAPEITEMTNKLFHINLGNLTKRIVSNGGFNAYQPTIKPYLSTSHARDRKPWAWESKFFTSMAF